MMPITNWHLHPKADIQFAIWNDVTVTVNEDGTRTYHAKDVYGTLNPFSRAFGGTSNPGTVICAVKFKEQHANQEDSGATVVRNGEKDGVWVYRLYTENYWAPYFQVQSAALTPIALAIYTPEDWERLQSMGVTLFDGDTMPRA